MNEDRCMSMASSWTRCALGLLLVGWTFSAEGLTTAGLAREGALRLERSPAAEASEDKPNPKEIVEKLGDVSEGFKKQVAEKADEWLKRMESGERKPLMDKINVLRAELCWARNNLLSHKACLEFLGLHCISGSTGEGICESYTKKVVRACHDPDTSEKMRPLICDIADVFETAMDPEEDTDGDKFNNDEDDLPMDPKEWVDQDDDHIGNKADLDIDGDEVPNKLDKDPYDPKVGAADDTTTMVFGGAGGPAPAPAPAQETTTETTPTTTPTTTEAPKPTATVESSWKFNKVERPLPVHGYHGPLVEHDDMDTFTGDWRKEWPTGQENERQAISRICEDFPENDWCKRQRFSGL